MNTPTSSAPHICLNVRLKIAPIWLPWSRPIAISRTATMIHETRIAVPPMYGAKLNTALTSGLAGSQAFASDEHAVAAVLNQLTFGSGDQGPVHAATTMSRIAKGIHACRISLP